MSFEVCKVDGGSSCHDCIIHAVLTFLKRNVTDDILCNRVVSNKNMNFVIHGTLGT